MPSRSLSSQHPAISTQNGLLRIDISEFSLEDPLQDHYYFSFNANTGATWNHQNL